MKRERSGRDGSRSPQALGPVRLPPGTQAYMRHGDMSARISGFIKEEKERGKKGRHKRYVTHRHRVAVFTRFGLHVFLDVHVVTPPES